MKRNYFGETILQPGDDVGAAFSEAFDTDIEANLTARFIEHDPEFGWGCTISDEDGSEMEVHDFESEEALRKFLTDARIDIDE